nr:alcohol dehydrogenase catalytic domain-containing protein [Rhodanobacter sp. C05]
MPDDDCEDADHARHPLPAILGIDLAGVVTVAGPGVTAFRVGDEVYGMTGGAGGAQGSLAGYARQAGNPDRRRHDDLRLSELKDPSAR